MGKQLSFEELVERDFLIRREIEEVEKRHEEELKKLKEAKVVFDNLIKEQMINMGIKSLKTKAGQPVLAEKTSFRVEDQQEFKRHVIGSEDWEMIVWAVKRSAAELFEASTGTLPPGVAKSSTLELRLYGPEKKRVRKPTTTQIEGEQEFDAFGDNDEEPKEAAQ